jgi:hypothetical protein
VIAASAAPTPDVSVAAAE